MSTNQLTASVQQLLDTLADRKETCELRGSHYLAHTPVTTINELVTVYAAGTPDITVDYLDPREDRVSATLTVEQLEVIYTGDWYPEDLDEDEYLDEETGELTPEAAAKYDEMILDWIVEQVSDELDVNARNIRPAGLRGGWAVYRMDIDPITVSAGNALVTA